MDMSATTDIDRPPDEVWSWVMDVRNDSRWRTGIVESGLLSEPPIEVGSVGFAKTERAEVRWKVRSLVLGASVDWDLLNGPIRGTGGYRVERRDSGTRFTLVADVIPTDALRLLGPLFAWIGRRQNRADVSTLKGLLESD